MLMVMHMNAAKRKRNKRKQEAERLIWICTIVVLHKCVCLLAALNRCLAACPLRNPSERVLALCRSVRSERCRGRELSHTYTNEGFRCSQTTVWVSVPQPPTGHQSPCGPESFTQLPLLNCTHRYPLHTHTHTHAQTQSRHSEESDRPWSVPERSVSVLHAASSSRGLYCGFTSHNEWIYNNL